MSVPEHLLAFERSAPEPHARWPERIIEIAHAWPVSPGDDAREDLVGEFWLLLNAALARYLRIHSLRFQGGNTEDLEDIASEKTLGLLRRFDRGAWDPREYAPAALAGFISTTARNGLIDHHRVVSSKRSRAEVTSLPEAPAHGPSSSPELAVDRQQFAESVRHCALAMTPRARTVWFLRALLGLPSRVVAAHPAVRMKVGAVDMMMSRCRHHMAQCMRSQGFQSADIPPGVLPTLWEAFRAEIDTITPSQELQR